jgi:hypothetical protein
LAKRRLIKEMLYGIQVPKDVELSNILRTFVVKGFGMEPMRLLKSCPIKKYQKKYKNSGNSRQKGLTNEFSIWYLKCILMGFDIVSR